MEVVIVRNIRLETNRLILREVQEKDAMCIANGLATLNVTRYLAKVPHPYELTHAVDFIKRTNADMQSETRGAYPLAITLKPEMCKA